MKYKKFIIASIVTVFILAISYTAFYYKSPENEYQLTQKRNAKFEYLQKNNNTSFTQELSDVNRRPH
jgi:hypothetical protein